MFKIILITMALAGINASAKLPEADSMPNLFILMIRNSATAAANSLNLNIEDNSDTLCRKTEPTLNRDMGIEINNALALETGLLARTPQEIFRSLIEIQKQIDEISAQCRMSDTARNLKIIQDAELGIYQGYLHLLANLTDRQTVDQLILELGKTRRLNFANR